MSSFCMWTHVKRWPRGINAAILFVHIRSISKAAAGTHGHTIEE